MAADGGAPTVDGEASTVDGEAPTRRSAAAADALQIRDPERYDVLGEHGRGGLGTVARAYDRELGRQVAIKEMLQRGDTGEVRFLREALITARLEHPGIVPIHEAGRWPDGTPFYVMKLVAGRSLKELLEERRTVEERIALLHHVIAVADAMAYAHERKIIHRDLKPANVIAGDFGETVVIDWGLAKDLSASRGGDAPGGGERDPRRGAADGELTADGSVLGTPMYMAPEQWRGEAVDQRADVFAIGAMLWELCSLQRVPPADARLRDRLLRRARIDRDLAAIIAKALAPDPAARYRDAGELAHDLRAFKSGARITARSYSPLAVIAHWTRRHRALAATIAAAAALALVGGAAYVRNIAVERDRADAQREIASAERDNARLSEAAALLERDPTRARELLDQLALGTPRYALLRSRASHNTASRVIRAEAGLLKLRIHPVTSEIVAAMDRNLLATVDADRGELHVLDRAFQGALAPRADHWIYASKPFGAPSVTVAATTRSPRMLEIGTLLAGDEGQLLSAVGRTYALEGSALYELESTGPRLLRRGVRSIAGNEHLLLVCMTTGELEIERDGAPELRATCAKSFSSWPMMAVDDSYAALLDPSTLLLVRGKQSLRLPTKIEGEYELALAASGLLAVADFSDKTWFVRPGGTRLELGPPHPSRPTSVAAAGPFAAWGYNDGVVVAVDTRTDTVWKLSGHTSAAALIAIDARRERVVSAGGNELRVWPLAPSPLAAADRTPCTVLTFALSRDRTRALFDCDDGAVREWSFASGKIHEVHRHDGVAFGVAWLRDTACSAGFDGRFLCTEPGGAPREILSGVGEIKRVLGRPDDERIAIAAQDGTVRELDGVLHTLFTHDAEPYQLAYSPDGRWLASGADDGSVIVWDGVERRVSSKRKAHDGRVASLGWRDGELWTASIDGTLRRWRNEPGALVLVDTTRGPGSFGLMHALADGWIARVDGRELLVHRAAPVGTLRFDLGHRIEHMGVSSDGRYAATVGPGELVVVDRIALAVAALPVATSGRGYVGFIAADTLLINTADGLFTMSVSALPFVSFDARSGRE
jgi:serine/threonine protein kinase/WD40 repeat protein